MWEVFEVNRFQRALAPIVFAGSMLFGDLNAQTRADTITVNPHVQLNDTALDYYGSGDVNNDNSIHWDDLDEMDFLIGQWENDNYRADVNGNGRIDFMDKILLKNYLENPSGYLPAHWNKTLRNERIDWANKMAAIDKTDELPYITDSWMCGDFAAQFSLNMRGVEGTLPLQSKYDLTQIGRYNVPFCNVSLISYPHDFYHGIVAVLVGNNAENYDDWYFIEPQNDGKRDPASEERMQGGDIDFWETRSHDGEIKKYSIFMRFEVDDYKPTLSTNPHMYFVTVNLVKKRDTSGLGTEPLYLTAIDYTELMDNVNIYPNPAKDNFTIDGADNFDLKIYSIGGELRYEQDNYNGGQVYPNLKPGFYILKLDDIGLSKKLIIQ